MKKISTILFILIFTNISLFAQRNNATVRGTIRDSKGKPLDVVNIALKEFPLGTSSNRKGEFILRIPAKQRIIIVYSSIGYTSVYDTIVA